MDETEVAVKLEGHDHEIGSLKYRVKELESNCKTMQELTISVNKMAVNMENMFEELREQGSRLKVLEKVPLETNKQIKNAVITALVGGVIGAVLTTVLNLI